VATAGHGENCTFSVKYIESYGNTTEKDIPYSCVTDLGNPFHLSSTARQHSAVEMKATAVDDDMPNHLHEILSMAYSKKYRRGWRARQLGFDPATQKRSESFCMRLCQDARELVGYLSAAPKTYIHHERGKTGRFKVRKAKFNPKSLRYLAEAWGVDKKTLYNHLQRAANPQTKTTSPTQMSIIDNFESAKVYFTGRRLYIQHRIQTRNAEYDAMQHDLVQEQSESIAWKARIIRSHEWREEVKGEWITINTATRNFWECRARSCLAMHSTIRDRIIESLRQNPSKSFRQVAIDIGDWCCAATICHWFVSHGSSHYVERCLPLLTTEQMRRHVEFSEKLLKNWGLALGKYLWIHYDEKWFYGWVSRTNAKKCEILGLEKSHPYLYHRNHIEKVMAVAVTAFAFAGNVLNGGDGLKLGLYRVQSARIAK